MDGNGRWAKARGKSRIYGHIKGARRVKEIISRSIERGVSHLTLFAFSTENWQRPIQEVNFLMRLLKHHLQKEEKSLKKQGIRFNCIGDLNRLPLELKDSILELQETTINNSKMVLTIALSYGGRQELAMAFRRMIKQVEEKKLCVENINEEFLSGFLDTSWMPDPDLIIRTSGEMRISNFLLWQMAYSELYFCDTLWPDFDIKEFDRALESYEKRNRRFGCVCLAPAPSSAQVNTN